MAVRRITADTRAGHMRVGIVLSKFNAEVGELLLEAALRALREAGVTEAGVSVAMAPGALEVPLALQRLAR
jgi:6,7-dimethyl-8-ribityllumazine synthase